MEQPPPKDHSIRETTNLLTTKTINNENNIFKN